MSILTFTQDQLLWSIFVFGFLWVMYSVFWGGATQEKDQADTSFGFIDDVIGDFKDKL